LSLCALRLSLPGRLSLSIVPNFTSGLHMWMLFFVQPLARNSVIKTAKSCNLYIHTDFKIFSSLLNGVKVGPFASKFALFSVSCLKDEKLKKQTYKKTETCKLYSRVL